MDLRAITPVILTFDEEANISRTLAALDWARQIVVVDSLSSDRTVELASAHPQVRVVERLFDSHARQWNFAAGETGIETEWILAIDADYVITPELVDELKGLEPPSELAGYSTRFVYCIDGRRLRGSVYPPVTTLFRRGRGEFVQDGHTHRLAPDGPVGTLRNPILHDDRKPLARWLASQHRYMELEAEKLETPGAELGAADRIRKAIVVAPFLVFFYALFVKGAILDGKAGLYYALQRSVAEMILSLHLVQRRLRR
jgi:glycosyltransferase involved in cell wall biosynthesis